MKGDFSRYTWDRSKRYSGVLMQQGRVSVDADWNEQIQIQHHREQRTDIDVIGRSGTTWSEDPEDRRDSFRVVSNGTDLAVYPGVAYVDGLQVILEPSDLPEGEGEEPISLALDQQLFHPDFEYPTTLGTYVVYLEAWERHVDAIEDEHIREVALGGPDTATRKQIVWRVGLLRLSGSPDSRMEVLADSDWQDLVAEPTGLLDARVVPPEDEADPCEVPEQGGYSGLENQLYRVEVHRGNFGVEEGALVDPSTTMPTFLWCRENGSVSVAWLNSQIVDSTTCVLTVESTGRDENLGFALGQWVELTDYEKELQQQRGVLVQITAVDAEANTITVTSSAIGTTSISLFGTAPRVRRWSSNGSSGAQVITTTDVTEDGTNWIKLTYLQDGESVSEGVQISFDTTKSYRTGDFWVIPARTINGEIEWSGQQTAQGDRHRYLMLGVVTLSSLTTGEITTNTWGQVTDLRQRFVPLNEQIHMFVEGGDGQSGRPGYWLRAPLRVGVSNGLWPVANAMVRFTIDRPVVSTDPTTRAGGLQTANFSGGVYSPDVPPSGTGVDGPLYVPTDSDGIAMVWWYLDPEPTDLSTTLAEEYLHCRVKAELLTAHVDYDSEALPLHLVAHFTANPSVSRDVAWDGDCEHLDSAETVTEAVEILCDNYALYYVGGDGQSGEPGDTVPVPLTVRVANGEWGAVGVLVRFWIPTEFWGSGSNGIRFDNDSSLIDDLGVFDSMLPELPFLGPYQQIEVRTNENGYASVHLILTTSTNYRDIVYASIVDSGAPVGTRLVFNGYAIIEETSTIRTLSYVTGDGQTGLAGRALDGGLVVRVSDESGPRTGSAVRFTVGFLDEFVTTAATTLAPIQVGGVRSSAGTPAPTSTLVAGTYYTSLDVVTDSNGFASVKWLLGTYGGVEKFEVTAALLASAPGSAVATPVQLISFLASSVNRPAPTKLFPPGSPSVATEIERRDTFAWSNFGGFIFPWLIISDGVTPDSNWLTAVDVEIEAPVVYSVPLSPPLLGSHWVRLQGTVSLGIATNALIWTLRRDSTLNAWIYAVQTVLAGLERTTALLRVIVHPGLIPNGYGRGSFSFESRYYMTLDAEPDRPDAPGPGGLLDIPILDIIPIDPLIDPTDLDRPITRPRRGGGGPG